jgi:Phosphotransferase enzyme family
MAAHYCPCRARLEGLIVGEWEFVKHRTAADGAVWRSWDGQSYKRTGGLAVRDEADFQLHLDDLGYPVPRIIDRGVKGDLHYFVERSAGVSLHAQALADADELGQVSGNLISAALEISVRLFEAQARNSISPSPAGLRGWFEGAGFAANVRAENPDLDTPRVRSAVERVVHRLRNTPMSRSHLDYGLPNAFPAAVIDWQHHGVAPLGYDVYPMLDIAAFKGGSKGYRFDARQREAYLAGLDDASTRLLGRSLREYLGDFLFVKCFFFLALMRPTDPNRHDKHLKWQYRRALFEIGLQQYESSCTIRTETFPTLAEFTAGQDQPITGHP